MANKGGIPPVHPGEILREEFGVNEYQIETLEKEALKIFQRFKRLIREEETIDIELAEYLSDIIGNSVNFWLNLQENYNAIQNS